MDHVSYQFNEGIATITLDDGRVNALGPQTIADLRTALDRAEADEAVVLLTGRPERFCAGFDLKVLTSLTPAAADLLRAGFELSHRLLSFPRPVVIACTGHTFAMGSFLLLSGDHRIGVEGGDHKITANEVAIGMAMPRAATVICRQRLTLAHFERAVALAEVFDPQGALSAGFLDQLVPAGELGARSAEVAQRLAGLDARAHAVTKLRNRADMLDALTRATVEDDIEFRQVIAEVSARG